MRYRFLLVLFALLGLSYGATASPQKVASLTTVFSPAQPVSQAAEVIPPSAEHISFIPHLGLFCFMVSAPASGQIPHCMTEDTIPVFSLLNLRTKLGIPQGNPIWHSATQRYIIPQLPPLPKVPKKRAN